jgi:hypothetical protein
MPANIVKTFINHERWQLFGNWHAPCKESYID